MPSPQTKVLSRTNSGTPASLADSQKSNNDEPIAADVEALDEEEYFGDSSDGDENESRSKVCFSMYS